MIGKAFIDTFLETKRIVSLVSCRGMSPLGIGAAQFVLLRELGRSGPATQSTLARATIVDQSAAARAFTLLARRGWIRRKRGKEDRRESYVELTPLGRRFLKRVEAVHDATAELIASRVDERDLADLERILAKLAPLAAEPPVEPARRRR